MRHRRAQLAHRQVDGVDPGVDRQHCLGHQLGEPLQQGDVSRSDRSHHRVAHGAVVDGVGEGVAGPAAARSTTTSRSTSSGWACSLLVGSTPTRADNLRPRSSIRSQGSAEGSLIGALSARQE